ncbi:MAG: hypothetical protein FWH23_03320 [Bacteroidales bacterium]|nr:hypothetical protein [Bacteroidales bacterium]MCL2133700.1 hypothetical protein [Bacteroidales bacterium]
MKRYYSILLIIAITLALIVQGCKSEPPITISITPETIALPKLGGSQTLTVNANADWLPMPEATWITATKLNATVLKLEAAPNTSLIDRTTTVRCMAGTTVATVGVSQEQLTVRQVDSLALINLYHAVNGGIWKVRWFWATPITQWQGVTVVNNRVVELRMPDNNLSGPLPESMGWLTALQYCDLNGNNLTGEVPAAINQCTQIKYLDLSNNQLSGNFPSINALTQLYMLDISANNFTALPNLNTLADLVYLAFHQNKISGALPANLSSLTKLIYLDGSANSFTGNIPVSWSTLTKVRVFYMYGNALDGNIPAYIPNFIDLEELALDGNNLSDNIPTTLGDLSKLTELWLAQNRLIGAIPLSLVNNPHWSEWKANVCPQQAGYGFTGSDCTGSSPAPAPQRRSAVAAQLKRTLMNNWLLNN